MMMENNAALDQEWVTLQNNYEHYESGALMVKLAAVVSFFAAVAIGLAPWLLCLMVLVLWLQEGIFKTCQSRLGERLVKVERLLADGSVERGQAFQLHSTWLAQRPGLAGLLREYAASALRPTVAFPYAVLVAVDAALVLLR